MQDTSVVTRKDLRNFGLMMGAFVVLFLGVLIPWIWNIPYPLWPWIVAAVFTVPALIFPVVLKPVFIVWMKFAHVMGWINTRLLLSVVFYLIFFPLGIIMRLLGKDPMRRKFETDAKSYRVKSKQPSVDHLEKPF